jgi:SulP family sulfate permease
VTVGTERQERRLGLLPILDWLPSYQRPWIRRDMLAAVVVWSLLIPEGMAFAEVAGLPPQALFFAAPGALLGYALFGTSRQLIVAPAAAAAALSMANVIPVAQPGTDAFVEASAALAILVGIMLFVFRTLRLGSISEFISQPILVGFLFGIAIILALEQLPNLLGIEDVEGRFLKRLWHLVSHLDEAHRPTVVVGVASLLLLILLHQFVPRLPAGLIVVGLAIVASNLFDLHEEYHVHVVGEIPTGHLSVGVPWIGLNDLATLALSALAIALVVFAESIGPAREFAEKRRYEIDDNQELAGLGAGNALSGLFGGFLVSGNVVKSIENEEAGAETQLSAVFAAALTIITGITLVTLFESLPEATIAAVVIFAVRVLMNTREMHRFYRLSPTEFGIAMVALVGVITLDIHEGLFIAIILAVILLAYQASRPTVAILGRAPDGPIYQDIAVHPDFRPIAGLLIMRLDGPLSYINNMVLRRGLKSEVRRLDPRPRAVLLDLEATSRLDITSASMLKDAAEYLAEEDVVLLLANVRTPVQRMLEASAFFDTFDRNHLYRSLEDAVQAFEQMSSTMTEPSSGTD